MIVLTEEQRRELDQAGPICACDPVTNETYVLVPVDVYDRLRTILGDDWSEDAYRAAMSVFAREGWEDPRMDVYDELDPRRKS